MLPGRGVTVVNLVLFDIFEMYCSREVAKYDDAEIGFYKREEIQRR
jgi:hypothetical protein